MPTKDCGACEQIACSNQRLGEKDLQLLIARLLCEVADNTAGGGGGGGEVVVAKQEPIPLTGFMEAAAVTTFYQTIINNGGPSIRLRILIISSTFDEDVEIALDGFTGAVRVRAGSSITIDYGASDMEKDTNIYLQGFAGALPTTGNISITAIGPAV